MRNGQQKRMRGRNNRRSSNPMTRVYESNGPDVKVRGTAHHIAEKYQQLARDAQSSGDHVAAENYYQHAEHYQRLIAALQGQFGIQPGREDEMDDDEMDDLGFDAPQPSYQPREQSYQQREGGPQRPQRDNRQSGNPRRPRDEDGEGNYQPREFRGPRRDDADGNYQPRPPRDDRQPREERQPREDRQPRYSREEGGEGYSRPQRPMRDDRQPREERAPREERPSREEGDAPYVARAPRPPRDDRPPREERQPREARAPREDSEGYVPRPVREPRPPRVSEEEIVAAAPVPVPPPAPAPAPAPRSRARKVSEDAQPELGLPSFITGSVAPKGRAATPAAPAEEQAEDAPRFPTRRRRRVRTTDEDADGTPAADTADS